MSFLTAKPVKFSITVAVFSYLFEFLDCGLHSTEIVSWKVNFSCSLGCCQRLEHRCIPKSLSYFIMFSPPLLHILALCRCYLNFIYKDISWVCHILAWNQRRNIKYLVKEDVLNPSLYFFYSFYFKLKIILVLPKPCIPGFLTTYTVLKQPIRQWRNPHGAGAFWCKQRMCPSTRTVVEYLLYFKHYGR